MQFYNSQVKSSTVYSNRLKRLQELNEVIFIEA
jgi:hypothetical protein